MHQTGRCIKFHGILWASDGWCEFLVGLGWSLLLPGGFQMAIVIPHNPCHMRGMEAGRRNIATQPLYHIKGSKEERSVIAPHIMRYQGLQSREG